MVSLPRVRRLIKTVEINEQFSSSAQIYIDFHDHRGRARWYLFYSIRDRTFGGGLLDGDGMGMQISLPAKLRQHLIHLTPPEIIAHCTAASLGVGQCINLMVKRDPPPWS
ncbi:hypothetical protein F9K79_09745 [Ochrobactrum sp. Kaboul]|nr:hypothetical protein F9K79_09745 [Ochrobactrum sp. Kaboul]